MEGSNKNQGFFDGNPKMIFVFGLVTGIAVTVIFSGGINLPSFDNGGGARGTDSKIVADFGGDGEGSGFDSGVELAPVTADEHILGDITKAKVVLVEYSDFECPFCERHHPTMQQAVDEFGDDVAWVYRHFPLSFHPEARPAALASECAAEQGKFWEFGDEMFENQSKLGDDFYAEVAADLGLDMNQYNDCYESEKYADIVDADQASGSAAGVSGTPATFVNGTLVSGAIPYSTLKDAIEQELNK
jgi:protein-disulfide isomerase